MFLFLPALSIPSGYVTLTELGALLGRQGVSVRVSPGCADDVYAIRAEGIDWSALRGALVADGRLAVEADGEGWRIGLDARNQNAERAALTRFLATAQVEVQRRFAPVVKVASEVMRRQTANNDFDISEMYPREWLDAPEGSLDYDRMRLLTSTVGGSSMLGYESVAMPALLTDPRSPTPFNVTREFTVARTPIAFAPFGDFRLHPTFGPMLRPTAERPVVPPETWAQLNAFARAARLMLEPTTMTLRMFNLPWWPKRLDSLVQADAGSSETLAPLYFALKAEPRLAREGVLPDEGDAPMPARSLRPSEALLRWAEAKERNVVAYVSPMTDLPLLASARRSPRSVVDAANAGSFDPTGLSDLVRERTSGFEPHPKVRAATRLTLTKAGDFLVLRNEERLLDGLCAGTTALPTAWRNRRLRDGRPGAEEALRAFARVEPGRWRGRMFPSVDLEFANPASLGPVAAEIVRDPEFLREVVELGEGKALRGPELSGGFRAALYAAADRFDYSEDTDLAPILVRTFVRDPRFKLDLRVARKKDVLHFEVWVDGHHRMWSAWLRNVALG